MNSNEDSTLQFWKEVFQSVRKTSCNTLLIDEKTERIYDGADKSCYPEIKILGIFRLRNGSYVAISVNWESDWDYIVSISFEVQRKVKNFQSVSEKEKALAQAA